MLNKNGLWLIVGVLALYAVVHLGFAPDTFSPAIAMPTLLGGFAYLLMSFSMLLSTRAYFLEKLFGGLDRMYQVHKFCGVFALLLVLVHFFVAPEQLPNAVADTDNAFVPSAPLGMVAMIFLVVSLIVTLNRKIRYSVWRPMHKSIALVYLLATGHFLTIPDAFKSAFGPSGLLLIVAGIIGIASFIYTMSQMKKRNVYEYRLSEVNPMVRATELVLTPVGEKLTHQAGQFAFVEIQDAGWNEPHPFTISSHPADAQLRFTVKVLGDWTRKVREELKAGATVKIRGPYGHFNTQAGGQKQVWLAGGVGLTPFLSAIRAMADDDKREIYFVYAARNEKDAIYLDELQQHAANKPNVKLITLYSDDKQFARVDMMKAKLPDDLSAFDYFLCGPKPMVDGMLKDLKTEGVKRNRIHTEAFEFR